LSQGFQMLPMLREVIPVEEVEDKGLPQLYVEQARAGNLKAAVLQKPGHQGLLYYFFDEATRQYAQSLIDDAHANTTATVSVSFGISFLQMGHAAHYNLDNVLASFKIVYGWEVKPSPLGRELFEFLLLDQPTDEAGLARVKSEIERRLLLLSLLYRAGMYLHYFHASIIPRGLTPYGVGPAESASAGFMQLHVDHIAKVVANDGAFRAAQMLQAFYRQTTKVGRLALGWMALEDVFGSAGITAHILKKHERKELERIIADGLSIEGDRKQKLIECFRGSNSFRRSRNDIMADRLAALNGNDWKSVREKIGALSKARAKAVHSFASEDDFDISMHERFIEGVLHRYMLHESGTPVLNLRGY
jgi:hypothetical protein